MDTRPNRASASADLRPSPVLAGPNPWPMMQADALARWPVLASLRDFAMAALRPDTPLRRAIVAALCIKLVMITALWVFVSLDHTRIAPTDQAVARVIGVEPH